MYIKFFLNGPAPASFTFIFGLFKQTLQFLQQIYVKKCPSSIRCQDSNPRPLARESLPITTRPGLPPKMYIKLGGNCTLATFYIQAPFMLLIFFLAQSLLTTTSINFWPLLFNDWQIIIWAVSGDLTRGWIEENCLTTRSEFKSRWSLHISINLLLKRTKINKKKPRSSHFFKKGLAHF